MTQNHFLLDKADVIKYTFAASPGFVIAHGPEHLSLLCLSIGLLLLQSAWGGVCLKMKRGLGSDLILRMASNIQGPLNVIALRGRKPKVEKNETDCNCHGRVQPSKYLVLLNNIHLYPVSFDN
jgi:hypothetical protein